MTQIDPPAGGSFTAYALGDGGHVAGTTVVGSAVRGARWLDGAYTELPPPAPRTKSYARDVDEDGVVVGTADPGVFRAVRWGLDAVPVDLGPNSGPWEPKPTPESRAVAISESGTILGQASFDDPGGGSNPERAVRLPGDGTAVSVWDPPSQGFPCNSRNVYPAAVSPDGLMALVTHDNFNCPDKSPILVGIDGSGATSLFGCLADFGASTFDQQLGNNSVVVGQGSGTNKPKRWAAGACTDMQLPPSSGNGTATAINSNGEAVGRVVHGGSNRGLFWEADGDVKFIDELLGAGSPWKVMDAIDVNDKGWILASATKENVFHLVLIKPGALAVSDEEVEAPEAGTVDMEFEVTLPSPEAGPVTVQYATADGPGANGAKAGTDYTQTQGTLTFDPGQTSKTVKVPVKANGFQGDRTFFLDLANPTGTTIEDGRGVGTIRGRGPLQVTITPEASTVEVEQGAQGPVTKHVKVVVDVRNRGDTTIDSVTVPDKLTLGWDMPAPAMGFPITQTQPESLDLGSIPAGGHKSATYTLHVTADGKFTLEALVLGDLAGQTVKALGSTKFAADTQLLVQSNELGARVRSQKNPDLVQAGTQFLINVTLENRSTYRKIVVEPIYAKLDGNAKDGHLTERDGSSTAPAVEGSLDEVQPSNWLELPPGARREYVAVVRTAARDAFQDVPPEGLHEGIGGTRASVGFDPPKTYVVTDAKELIELPKERVVLTEGSDQFQVSIDDAAPPAPPFDGWNAVLYVSKGSVLGLWNLTYGTLRGAFELPPALFFGAIDVSMGTLNAMSRLVELWTAIEDDESARGEFIGTVYNKVLASIAAAPDAIALAPANLFQTVSDAVGRQMTSMSKDWFAGDWKGALTAASAGGTEFAAIAAQSLGPGILARLPAVATRWNAVRTALYAKALSKLAPVIKKVTQARGAAAALAEVVKPGLEFTSKHMTKIFGVSSTEMKRVAQYAQAHRLSIVLRSRAQQSIGFLEKKVAVLKPYWIKSKNVNEIDVAYLGYREADIGKVIMKGKLPNSKAVKKALAANDITPDNPLYAEVLDRLKTRLKEQRGELREMKKWHNAKKVKGKWPWEENGVDPLIQADEYKTYGFRLQPYPDPKKGPDLMPQIQVKGEKPPWKFITGDIDLIAITRADGRALSNVEHVQHLKALKVLIGAQHPESATWVMKGKFWFKAKRNYLRNDGECCLAQFGADGKVRAVEFNEALSEPEKWTKLRYRIYWNGGYQAGLGQR